MSDAGVLEELSACLPEGWEPTEARTVDAMYSLVVGGTARRGVKRFHLLYAGSIRLARTFSLDLVQLRLQRDLELYAASMARRRIFIHAGAVGWKGRGLVLPGESFSGKSSLVEALLAEGATYYSDEFAVVDARGRLHPYARPLALRDEGRFVRKVTAAELGAEVGHRPLPVGLVALASYRRGRSTRLRRLTPGRAVLAMFENTVGARTQTQMAMAYLKQLSVQATVVRGPRGEAAEAAPAILRRLEALAS